MMWNGLFDMKKDLVEFEKNFRGSSLYYELEKLGFPAYLKINTENKIRFTFVTVTGEHLQMSFDVEFENYVIYVYFSSNLAREIQEHVAKLVFDSFISLVEKSESHFVLMIESEPTLKTDNSVIKDDITLVPIGEKSHVVVRMLENLSLVSTMSPWSSFRLKDFTFHNGLFFINWNLDNDPYIKISYSHHKDTNDFLSLHKNTIRKIRSNEEMDDFFLWLRDVESDTLGLLDDLKEKISITEPNTVIVDKFAISIPGIAEMTVRSAVSDYMIGYQLTSPSFQELFFSSKEKLMEAAYHDYMGKKEMLKMSKSLVSMVEKYGSVVTSPFSDNIARCFDTEIRFSISYTIKDENITYLFKCNKLDGIIESSNTDECLKESNELLEKYIQSLRIRSIFKDDKKNLAK